MSLWQRFFKFIVCILVTAIAVAIIPLLIQIISAAIQAASTPVSCNDYLARIAQAFGMSCATYQAGVKAYGWLMVLGFVAILAGLIIAVARCFISVFRGREDEDEEDVKVRITDIEPMILYGETESTGSPSLTLQGDGEPSGGTYQWSIISGEEKLNLESGLNQSSLMIEPRAPSNTIGDIVIKLEYSTPDGNASTQESLTIHTPSSALQILSNITSFNGPVEYGYDHLIRYRILDQFGDRFPVGHQAITEKLTIIHNPRNTQFEEREFLAVANAEYLDTYTLIFNGQPVPSNYIARIRQIIRAEGIVILNRIVVWKNTHVEFE